MAFATILASPWLHWTVVTALFIYTCFRRTLGTWILLAMVVGAALGHDFPSFAVNLRILAQIFLRLIKTIIAPLVFASLVSGIAGHADLKAVGRMGVKAIIYFEVVTTLALFIGLAAINLSQAGVGAQIPGSPTEQINVEKLSATDTVLHVFPREHCKVDRREPGAASRCLQRDLWYRPRDGEKRREAPSHAGFHREPD